MPPRDHTLPGMTQGLRLECLMHGDREDFDFSDVRQLNGLED